MSSDIVAFTDRWTQHVRECSACEDWWLGGCIVGPRCYLGFAISEVLAKELEEQMPPVEEAARRG